MIRRKGMQEQPRAPGKLIQESVDYTCVWIGGGGGFGELIHMKGVHLGSNLVNKALKELVDGIRDGLSMVDDCVDELEEIVWDGAVIRLV